MAIIGKIRSNSTLVVAVVAGALILFVLGDLLGSRGGGGGQDSQVAGEIFGEEVDLAEYNTQVQQETDQAKAQAQQQGQDLSDDQTDGIADDVWNRTINRKIFERELDGFNFTITSAELNDLIFGNNIQEYVKSFGMFKNKITNQFSVDSVKMWRQRIERIPDGKTWWVTNLETPVKDNRRITKYFNLVAKGLYVTNAELEQQNKVNNRKYKIRFVAKSFSEIPDSTIKVTDDEIKAYYEKNKNRKKYEQPGSRAYSYVEFPLIPSDYDKEKARERAEHLKKTFTTSKDDSAFVATFADTKAFNDQWSQPGMFPPDLDTIIQKADSGTIVGPFLSGEYWKVVKVRAVKTEPEARVRHILIGNEVRDRNGNVILKRTPQQVKQRADSIMNIIKKKNNFDEMVALTDDLGSKDNKGVYEWFTKGRMVEAFEKASFEGKLNSLQKVETQYGIHLVEPLGRRDAKRVKAATVDVKVRPLDQTNKEVRTKAVEFLTNLSDASKFQEVAQKMKLVVKKNEIGARQKAVDEVPQNMYMNMGGGATPGGRIVAREIHKMNEGEVSANPVIFNDKYVVIKLDNIKEKGVPEFEDVKEMMKLEVVREKKGELLAKKMKDVKSLDELAARMKTDVKEGELMLASTILPGTSGTEYEVIGSVMAMQKVGTIKGPLKGKNGVYVVMVTGMTEAPAMKEEEKKQQRTVLTNALRQRVLDNRSNEAYQALRELAKIKDTRPVF